MPAFELWETKDGFSNGGAIAAGAYVDDFELATEATGDPDGDGLVGQVAES